MTAATATRQQESNKYKMKSNNKRNCSSISTRSNNSWQQSMTAIKVEHTRTAEVMAAAAASE